MDEAKRKEVRQWLIKSIHELGSARRLMEGEKTYLDTAVYHCQQAAEKAIMAYLTYRDIIYEKIYNLIDLLALCLPSEPSFSRWEETAEILTPYATEFLYPGDVLEPEKSEVEQAFTEAGAFVNFVMQLLPDTETASLAGELPLLNGKFRRGFLLQ